jgi:RNA polymerase sigma-70 factor, ECF subfamily
MIAKPLDLATLEMGAIGSAFDPYAAGPTSSVHCLLCDRILRGARVKLGERRREPSSDGGRALPKNTYPDREKPSGCDSAGPRAKLGLMGSTTEMQGGAEPLGTPPVPTEEPAPRSAGGRGRFGALLEAHGGIVRRIAAAYGRGAADRGDLMQDIALQLWRSWPSYDPARPFGTWMYRIALNVAISQLRRRGREGTATVDFDDVDPGALADPRGGGAERAQEREGLERLQRLLADLNPLDRALLVLWLDEQSYRQIADVLGLTETNVATKLSRLKERLRTRAKDL